MHGCVQLMLLLSLASFNSAQRTAGSSNRPGSSVKLVNGVVWPLEAPGAPMNVTVTAGADFAEIAWDHALPSEGGRAIQFTIKWQEIDEWEARCTLLTLLSSPIDPRDSHLVATRRAGSPTGSTPTRRARASSRWRQA